jgi:hypothetical protein
VHPPPPTQQDTKGCLVGCQPRIGQEIRRTSQRACGVSCEASHRRVLYSLNIFTYGLFTKYRLSLVWVGPTACSSGGGGAGEGRERGTGGGGGGCHTMKSVPNDSRYCFRTSTSFRKCATRVGRHSNVDPAPGGQAPQVQPRTVPVPGCTEHTPDGSLCPGTGVSRRP